MQKRLFSLKWFQESRYQAIIVGTTASIIAFLSGGRHETEANNYVYLAQAFLQGHTWIHWPGLRIDALLWHGRYYVIEAPVPALLLLPFVALFGFSAQPIVAGSNTSRYSDRGGLEFIDAPQRSIERAMLVDAFSLCGYRSLVVLDSRGRMADRTFGGCRSDVTRASRALRGAARLARSTLRMRGSRLSLFVDRRFTCLRTDALATA